MSEAEDNKKALSVKDRDRLLGVAKGRFKILKETVKARAAEAKEQIRTQVRAEVQEAIKTADDGFKPFRKEADELLKQQQKEQQELNDRHEEEREAIQDKIQDEVDRLAREEGVAPAHWTYAGSRGHYAYDINIPDSRHGWVAANEDEIVRERFAELTGMHNNIDLTLQEQELDVTEKLLLSGVDGDQAKDYLEGIPSLEELIPLPAGEEKEKVALKG